MNAAVHTSTSVHRCRDDVPGTSAIYLTQSGGRCHDGCGQQALPIKGVLTSLLVIVSGLSCDSECALDCQDFRQVRLLDGVGCMDGLRHARWGGR